MRTTINRSLHHRKYRLSDLAKTIDMAVGKARVDINRQHRLAHTALRILLRNSRATTTTMADRTRLDTISTANNNHSHNGMVRAKGREDMANNKRLAASAKHHLHEAAAQTMA